LRASPAAEPPRGDLTARSAVLRVRAAGEERWAGHRGGGVGGRARDGMSAEQYIGLALLGLGVGVYGTLIGAGGGFVLMPVLLVIYPGDDAAVLASISLAVVFFNALSGSAAYAQLKRIDYRSGLLLGAATLPGAVLGALHTAWIPRRTFDLILGVLLVVAAAFLIARPRTSREAVPAAAGGRLRLRRRIVDVHGTAFEYSFNVPLGMAISVGVGYVSSLLGIGGGIIHVPVLSYLLGFPVHVATATSHFVLAAMALAGTVVHVLTGTFAHGVHRTIALTVGVVAGAQLGAHLSERIRGGWILRGLALALAVVGVRILIVAC
jgi:uncharacterized protein